MGRGTGFEAALGVAADELDDQRVFISAQSDNERSLKLARRLGLRLVTTFEWFDVEQSLLLSSLHFSKPGALAPSRGAYSVTAPNVASVTRGVGPTA
ncbi:hypothetical protein NBRGN_067_00290 [Nocardia brasiliensis NBRC 14402]|nr:hypothetical protein NBRGN_067_00290 [Nocardia brasiliensis NBRC 14402]